MLNSPDVTEVEESYTDRKSSKKLELSKAYRSRQNAKKSYKKCMENVRKCKIS